MRRKVKKINIKFTGYLVVAGLAFLDQFLKRRFFFLNRNSRVFFGFVENRSKVCIVLFMGILIIALAIVFLYSKTLFQKAPLFLIISGGISNLADRILVKEVVDYLDFCGYKFNLADLMIYAGVAALFLNVFYKENL